MCLNHLELVHKHPAYLCFPCNDVDREGSVYVVQLRLRLDIPFSHEIGFCDRSAFSSNSPARMRNSVQIDTPLSSRARALWRSFFLPFYRPTHSFCACLSACSGIYDMSHSIRTLLLFFFFFFFERVDESNIKAPSADRPLLRMRGWFL